MLVTTSPYNYRNNGINSNNSAGASSDVNADITKQPVNKISEVDTSYQNYERDALKRLQKEHEEKQTQQPSPQAQTRFDVDEASLALALSVNESVNEGQQNNKPHSTLGYDQPSNDNLTAVSAYQNVDNLAKRESVRDVFGIDLFA